jgi:hypothetical protein
VRLKPTRHPTTSLWWRPSKSDQAPAHLHGLIDLLRRWHLVWAGPGRGLWNQGGQLGVHAASFAQPLPFMGDHGIGEMPCAAGQIDGPLV